MDEDDTITVTVRDLRLAVFDGWHDSAHASADRVVAILADPRYIVGNWTHLFVEDGKQVERECRIAFDRTSNALYAMQVKRDHKWQASTEIERADLTDSLVNANPEALENPTAWDLVRAPRLPDWA